MYEISGDHALQCVALSTATLLRIILWTDPQSDVSDIAVRCGNILRIAQTGRPNFVVQEAGVA